MSLVCIACVFGSLETLTVHFLFQYEDPGIHHLLVSARVHPSTVRYRSTRLTFLDSETGSGVSVMQGGLLGCLARCTWGYVKVETQIRYYTIILTFSFLLMYKH